MQKHFLSGTADDLKKTLSEINRQMEEDEAQAQAKDFALPYINLHNFPVDLGALGIFAVEEATEMQSCPFYIDAKDLRIATHNPQHPLLLEKITELSKKHKVSLYYISLSSFNQILKFYSKVLRPKTAVEEVIKIQTEENYREIFQQLSEIQFQHQKTASQILQYIFGAAVFYKSSDIHLEPEEHFFKLRFRIDGVLQDMLHIDKMLQRQLTTRIKILSHLKLNTENVAQDGRITFYFLGKPIDVRVSVLPSAYGEEFVLRLLGTGAVNLKLKDLGFREESKQAVEKALSKPQGMILTTGPTGSGKTTSLYAFLNELNEPGVKIITLEDPVEYKLEGVVQTPIDHSQNFDFAKGLRAILRQDPDIVMVGEIRDQETAEVATQAALTGHMVLSTLHTNDSAGAIPRLLNMGVKPFVVAPALSCVLAQRLVRKICQNCKVAYKIAPNVMEKIIFSLKQIAKSAKVTVPDLKNLQFFHSTGCEKCHNLGYSGRIGVYEVLEVTEQIQDLIAKDTVSINEYKKVAQSQGMLTMLQDGLLKALDGITDVEEVFRVVGEG